MNQRTQKILRNYIFGWFLAGLVWALLRNIGVPGNLITGLSFAQRVGIFVSIWLIQGSLYGILFVLVDKYIFGRIPYIRLLLAVLVFQLMVAIVIGVLIFHLMTNMGIPNFPPTLSDLFALPTFPVGLVYTVIVNFLIGLFIQIDMMLGRGIMFNFIRGKYYQPLQDQCILMFLDLKGSTTLAEQLGHIKYSLLIQDCFRDLAVVHEFQADIYQYVGDEAVLVWKAQRGIKEMNCIRAFFAFMDRIQEQSAYYLEKYQAVPEFKAGANLGQVTIAEVGELKREIAFHGDTINTAARVQDQCNELNSKLLITEDLLQALELKDVQAEPKGKILLRGKLGVTNIYAVERVKEV